MTHEQEAALAAQFYQQYGESKDTVWALYLGPHRIWVLPPGDGPANKRVERYRLLDNLARVFDIPAPAYLGLAFVGPGGALCGRRVQVNVATGGDCESGAGCRYYQRTVVEELLQVHIETRRHLLGLPLPPAVGWV